ncbi:hypothetical protein RYH80_12090 [Halobaculum sp. MBLA0147]|uniref:hypothetical protein n=1 Tax=Halobaculum sp. MBLA0147 TaxID=3079934 RepID=UPI003525444C
MAGGKLGIQKLSDAEVHVQRYPGQERVEAAREELSNRVGTDDTGSVPANPETLAEEVAQIKQRQAQMMDALTTAEPGAAGGRDWGKTATKGVLGSLAGMGTGAALGAVAGSVVPGAGTAIGAATGAALSGAVSDLTKQGVEFMDANRPNSEAVELEQMYHEIRQMYAELKQGPERRDDELTDF